MLAAVIEVKKTIYAGGIIMEILRLTGCLYLLCFWGIYQGLSLIGTRYSKWNAVSKQSLKGSKMT